VQQRGRLLVRTAAVHHNSAVYVEDVRLVVRPAGLVLVARVRRLREQLRSLDHVIDRQQPVDVDADR
jgi:hypothetical protein